MRLLNWIFFFGLLSPFCAKRCLAGSYDSLVNAGHGKKVFKQSSEDQRQDNSYRGFKGRSWLDSQSLAIYGDFLERRHHFLRLGPGLKFYSGAATGHPLGQGHVTEELVAELRRHWLEGTQSETHKIFRAFGKTRFHIVPNNLSVKSENGGSHWTLILVDVKKGLIEYYDSYGHKPPAFIIDRMTSLQSEFSRFTDRSYSIVNVGVAHQKDGHSCGAYVLHYASLRAAGLNAGQIETLEINIDDVRKSMHGELLKQNLSNEAKALANLTKNFQRPSEMQIDAARAGLALGDFNLASDVRNMKSTDFIAKQDASESFCKQIADYRDLYNYLRTWSIPDYKVDKLIDEQRYTQLLEKYNLEDQRLINRL